MAANGHIHMHDKGKAGAFHNTGDGSNSWGPTVHRKQLQVAGKQNED